MDSKEFGAIIKNLRKERGLTLLELGERIGFSKSYLSLIENGKNPIPQPDTIRKLSRGLDVSYFYLMEQAGHTDFDYYLSDVWGDEEDDITENFKEVKVFVPDRYVFEDENGKEQKKIAGSADELNSFVFDLHYLINADLLNSLYYKGKVLNESDLKKIRVMLKTLFE